MSSPAFSPVPSLSQNISTPSPTASPQLLLNTHSSPPLPESLAPEAPAWNFEVQAPESFPAPLLGTVAISRPENGLEKPGILVQVGGFGAHSPEEFPGAEYFARLPGFGFQAPVQVGQNGRNTDSETMFMGYGSPEFPAPPDTTCDWRPPGKP